MPLQTTATTDIPFNLDGTIDRATWGESGGPFSVPAEEGPGLGAAVLASNTVNYEWQHPARHIRGIEDRFVKSDDGLFTSCVVRQGAWNDGAGTLNITLGPTRLVVDFAQDGGLVLELFAVAGSPEVLGASEDAYVDITDAGVVTVVAVPNNDPEPPLTASSVRFYKLVTDATELTSATLVDGVAPFPCLGPTVGIAAAQVTDMTIGGTLTATTVNISGLTTCEDLTVDGNTILGDAPGDTVTVTATMTVTPALNATAGIQAAAGTPIDFPEGATVPNGEDIGLGTNATITGGTTTAITCGTIDLIDDAGVAFIGEARFYVSSPGFGEGRLMHDGRALALGNGVSAPRLARPELSYVAGPINTAAAILDTGASKSLNMLDTEKAKIVITAVMRSEAVGGNIIFRVDADGSPIGDTSRFYEPIASASVVQAVTRVLIYTATADASVLFKARFGALASTTHASNISIEVSHIQ